MAFVLPTFNITANIWRPGNPVWNAPDVSTPANLCLGRRAGLDVPIEFYGATPRGLMWLLLPKGTDIRDGKAPAGEDTVEAPATSTRFYRVKWVDDIGISFANEHRFAMIDGIGPWNVPFPDGTGPYPPPPTPPVTEINNQLTGGPPAISVQWVAPSAGYIVVIAVTDNGTHPISLGASPPISSTPVTIVGGATRSAACFSMAVAAGVGSATLNVGGAPPSYNVVYVVLFTALPLSGVFQSDAFNTGTGTPADSPGGWTGPPTLPAVLLPVIISIDPVLSSPPTWASPYTTLFHYAWVYTSHTTQIDVALYQPPSITFPSWTVTPSSTWNHYGQGTLMVG